MNWVEIGKVKEPRQIWLKNKFCLAVATTSIPTSIKKSFEFVDYISDLDQRHIIPGRKAATSGIRQLYFKGKECLKMKLFAALSLLILTADIWSKPGFASSYLSITVHFISDSFKLESAVLELVYSSVLSFPSHRKSYCRCDQQSPWRLGNISSSINKDHGQC